MNASEVAAPLNAAARALPPQVVVLALALLLGMQPITTDLYLPALPLLKAGLDAPMERVQMTMAALLLAFGAGQLVMGPLSDRFGRRPVLLGGLALHAAGAAGAALAGDIVVFIALRAVQGVGLAASVVCARAMVRDLFEPHQGATVMSQGLSGLGVIAFASPTVGGLLAAWGGWRSSMTALSLCSAAILVFVMLKLPETAPRRDPQATAPGPLLRRLAEIAAHPGFRAWALLVASTYAGLYVLLAGTSFVYIGTLGMSTAQYGVTLATCSLAYIAGTFHCRRLLPRRGLAGAAWVGGFFTLAGGLSMLALGLADVRSVPLVIGAQWLYSWGHGFHQPCGQVGAVAPFPRAAGTASALAGFILALVAFGMGLWLGRALDGSLAMLGWGVAVPAAVTALIAWTLVRRHGEPGH
ncbi:Bcr/CflA family efflux MFS transporter [Ideonella alba]|uniref:Bcr/CflA family efflux transporter n=1 Tax=Ideonella alba TaxID=2824118 RepID=A0A940YAH7_9BURK|nr:Bcr/CflA family efflux MFS transporter [Ideonella alba]MBQ0930653.1 Bcr/CflA family efflux MFS transporter [Ideonella alba]